MEALGVARLGRPILPGSPGGPILASVRDLPRGELGLIYLTWRYGKEENWC